MNDAANDQSAVGDIVNMRWRLEAVHKLNEKACRRKALAIAPKGTSLRALVAASGVELLPLDF